MIKLQNARVTTSTSFASLARQILQRLQSRLGHSVGFGAPAMVAALLSLQLGTMFTGSPSRRMHICILRGIGWYVARVLEFFIIRRLRAFLTLGRVFHRVVGFVILVSPAAFIELGYRFFFVTLVADFPCRRKIGHAFKLSVPPVGCLLMPVYYLDHLELRIGLCTLHCVRAIEAVD